MPLDGKLAKVARVGIFLSGLLTLGCGVIHIVYILHDSDDWCTDVAGSNYDCIGSALAWSKASGFDVFRSEVNQPWRENLFSFSPDLLIDVWTAVFLGLFTLVGFFTQTLRIPSLANSWLATTLWLIVCMLWGQFAYAGDFGVISGFITLVICVMTLTCHFLEREHLPAKDLSGYVPTDYN
ncbi:hypothetical protein DIPPA_21158 [Diplonema papillatum]|nr:hypothetical protein DIPPA_21158 [Diplonema papillatum]